MKRTIKILVPAFFLIAFLNLLSFSAVKDKGIHGKASVTRDEKGVWFIEGKSLYDAFEAMGYCVAEDRLWQAELYRRNGKGRLSEIFGAEQLETDIFVRTSGYSEEELLAGFNSLDKHSQIIIQAYVDGFNRRIAEIWANLSLLPYEFAALEIMPEDWTVTDVLAWGILLARQFDGEALNTGQMDNAALLQELTMNFPSESLGMFNDLRWLNDPEAQTMIPEAKPKKKLRIRKAFVSSPGLSKAAKKMHKRRKKFVKNLKKINAHIKMGSYAWAVSGKKTTSKRPILYSGPQMGFYVPSIVLEGSIKAPGYRVSGMTVAGLPGIIVGRTPHHAWSLQVGHAHTVDYYLEVPGSGDLHRIETIKVKGAADVYLPVYRTMHGPVVHPMPYNPYTAGDTVVSWKYAHWGHEFKLVQAVFGFGKAKNMKEFGKAVEKFPISQQICYADRRGNIAYWMAGRDPVRPAGTDPRLPLIGDGTEEWPEPVRLKPRAHDSNPKQGFYGGWNNKSATDYDNSDGIFYGVHHRAHVIQDFLSTHKKLSFEDLRDLALNIATTDSFAGVIRGGNTWKFVAKDFSSAVQVYPTTERSEALALLEDWDGHFVAGGKSQWVSGTTRADAWVLQNAWIMEVLRLTFEDELGDHHPYILFNVLLHALAGPSSGVVNNYDWFQDRSGSGKPTTADEIIVLALDNVLFALGSPPWNVLRGVISYSHPMLGTLETTPFAVRSTYAQCVEIGHKGPVRIESMFPLGESGNIDISTGVPVFDENFFSMKPLYDFFTHRTFPLFKKKIKIKK
jgi:penicillin amidase